MKVFTTAAVVLLSSPLAAQANLVPNGSFEAYSQCPDNPGQIEDATNWVRIQGTPEYFNVCAADPWASVPYNRVGYQMPYDGGEAYAGIIIYSDSDWFTPPEFLRELIGVQLVEPLVPGIPVHASFRVSPAAFGTPGAQVHWTTNGVGLKFTFAPLVSQFPLSASNDADIQLGTVLLDTAGWTLVSGTFIPDSAYDAIVIGNFMSDSLLTTYPINPDGDYGVAYAYVDDVVITNQTDGVPSLVNAGVRISAWYDVERKRLCLSAPSLLGFPVEMDVVNSMGSQVAKATLARGATYTEIPCHLPADVYWVVPRPGPLSILPAPLFLNPN